jgi:hypothetical protein
LPLADKSDRQFNRDGIDYNAIGVVPCSRRDTSLRIRSHEPWQTDGEHDIQMPQQCRIGKIYAMALPSKKYLRTGDHSLPPVRI